MKALAVLILAAFLLVGCADSATTPKPDNKSFVTVYDGPLSGVYRVDDKGAGVICWVWNSAKTGGIDCMPIEQTRLGE